MPWTLQKRLLRYLLSQLDFLETDDLELEDLGVRWGQRSVVELKNVGLKTSVRHMSFEGMDKAKAVAETVFDTSFADFR